MTDEQQKELGKILWAIADQLRGAMNVDDFRDYMLSFFFLRYLSDNHEAAAKKELGKEYPTANGHTTSLQRWYEQNPKDVSAFDDLRRHVHYVIKPDHLWGNVADMARRQDDELLNTLQKAFKFIETEFFDSTFQGLFSEIEF